MEIIHLVNSMAPFLLLGFLLAGIMHAFIPGSLYQRHFGQPTFKSVIYSTLLAIPLPLCSCGVIPTAMSLRREGASRGSVISFLIATPQTGVDSILATYSMMGLPFAIVRPIAALVTALFGGQLANLFDRNGALKDEKPPRPNCACNNNDEAPKSFIQKIGVALRYAYVDMMEDIGKWLAVGLVIAGLITVYVPNEFFQQFAGNTPLSILIVLLFAIPMYLCATGSIPIAIALMMKGLTPGAALVLLMAGPAVNVASMLVIQRVMGTRTLMIYLASIVGGSILFAFGIDYLFPTGFFTDPLVANSACAHGSVAVFQWICTGVLTILLINAFIHRFFITKKPSCQISDNNAQSEVGSTPAQVMFIEGMKCNHCKANAEKALQGVTGVENVDIDLAAGTATVQGIFDLEAAITVVEEIGFKVNREKGYAIHGTTNSSAIRVFYVEGMKCNHCKANAEKALLGVSGVENVEIDLAAATATIQGRFDIEAAISSVEEIGFKVNREKSDLTPITTSCSTFHTLYIKGMKCNHCKANAEKAILGVAGVENVEIDLAASTATIYGVCNMDEVIEAVESIGFQVDHEKSDVQTATPKTPHFETIHIKGMKCNHCKANAEKAIRSVAGVENVEIDLAAATATIQGHFCLTEVTEALEAIGFQVKE